MPYILVRGILPSYNYIRGPSSQWSVFVSGLKDSDREQLTHLQSVFGVCSDSSSILYLQHPCVVLTALEVLGYKVVASSSTSTKEDYIEHMWTLRKDLSEPKPESAFKTVFF